MSYQNYLIKIGNYVLPSKYIKAQSYSAYANMQDVDPWTDADGYVHRNAVELKAIKIEFDTTPLLTGSELNQILTAISENYISPKERTVNLTAYIPEYDDYITQKAYVADFTPVVYGIFNGVIKYESIHFSIIGGVA